MTRVFPVGLVLALSACSESVTPRAEPPILIVTSPERATVLPDTTLLEVRGTAIPSADGLPVDSVEVNGVPAELSADGTFVASVPVGYGATLLKTAAKDTAGTAATDTRTVHAGEVRSIDELVESGVSAHISDESFLTIGKAAAAQIKDMDFAPIMTAGNPMVDIGDGPDCLYAQVDVFDVDMNNMELRLVPTPGGLMVDATVSGLAVPTYARYAAACIDGERPVDINADQVAVSGRVDLQAVNGQFVAQLVDTTVSFDNLVIDTTGLPGDVLSMFSYDSLAGSLVESAIASQLNPMLSDMLNGFAQGTQFDLFGFTIEMSVAPRSIAFDFDAGHVLLDSRVSLSGAKGASYVHTPNDVPPAIGNEGFLLSLADDAVNQFLASVAATGALNLTMQLPEPRTLFDDAKIEAPMAPMVTANETDGALRVVIGDMRVTLYSQGIAMAQLAVNAEMRLSVGGETTGLKLKLERPTLFFDVLEDEIPNISGYSDEDLGKVIGSVGIGLYDILAPLLSYVPLPMLFGVTLTDIVATGEGGYVNVTGSLQD